MAEDTLSFDFQGLPLCESIKPGNSQACQQSLTSDEGPIYNQILSKLSFYVITVLKMSIIS